MKILVPTDFSGPGDVACRFATDMALSHNGEVLVMKTSDVLSSSEIVSGRKFLRSSYFLKTVGDDYRVSCERLFNGDYNHKQSLNLMIERGPITVIAPVQQLIREQQIDLVVSGVSGIANDEFIGVDAAVQSSPSPAPVLTLKKGERVDSIQNIVLPISMSTNQTDFVLRARSLQEMYSAHLHLLFVKK